MVTFGNVGIVFFAALLISVLITPLSGRLAEIIDAIDHPDDERKHHECAIPRLGGIGISLGFLLPQLIFLPISREVAGLLTGASIIIVVGLLDDMLQLRASVKFIAQVLAAACFVFVSGAELNNLGDLLGLGRIDTGEWAPWVTIFCIVSVTNAMNLCDGLDGLAAGFSAIACVFFASLAVEHQDLVSLPLIIALMGGVFGFLRYNTHPARLFMGDIGSMMLGFGLSVIAVLMAQPFYVNSPNAIHPITLGLILIVPILDVLVVLIRRILAGRSPFTPDRTHLHHRLMALGLPHDQAVTLLYSVMMLFGCLVLVVEGMPDWVQLVSALVAAGILFGGVAAFERVQGRFYQGLIQPREMLRKFSIVTRKRYRWLRRNSMSISIIVLFMIGVAVVVARPPHPTTRMMLYAVLVSTLLLYPWHPDREHVSVQKGIVYLGVAALFLSIHLHASGWLGIYFVSIAVFSLVVVLGRAAAWSSETHGASSFQVLVLLIVAIVPLTLVPLADVNGMGDIVIACLEALPVSWLLNGYSIHSYRRNRRVTLMLVGLIAVLLFKSNI